MKHFPFFHTLLRIQDIFYIYSTLNSDMPISTTQEMQIQLITLIITNRICDQELFAHGSYCTHEKTEAQREVVSLIKGNQPQSYDQNSIQIQQFCHFLVECLRHYTSLNLCVLICKHAIITSTAQGCSEVQVRIYIYKAHATTNKVRVILQQFWVYQSGPNQEIETSIKNYYTTNLLN